MLITLFSLRKISVITVFVILLSDASAQNPFRMTAGARESGMASASVMNKGFWSSFQNQALLPLYRTAAFGFNYESRFSIKELGTRSAGLIIPLGMTSLSASYSRFGYPDFKREMITLACGLPLSDRISAGVQVDYMSERTTGEYLNNQFLTCEAGLIITVAENALFGIHIFNPVPNSLRTAELPSGLRAGIGSEMNSRFFAGAEVEMLTGMNPDFRGGFEYEAAPNFMLRGGFRSLTSSFSFGIGYMARPARMDIAFSTHERLGITSSVSIVFELTGK